MLKGIILHFLLLLSATAYSQECGIEGVRTKRVTSPGVYYSFSHGYCYHYQSTTIETGYKHHHASVTFMYRNLLRATPRMQDEIYLGYTYTSLIGRHVQVGGSLYARVGDVAPVERIFIDYRIYKSLYLHGSVVQVSDQMTHLIGGLKLIL